MKPVILVHGGAGVIRRDLISPEQEQACHEGLNAALIAGWKILETGGSCLDAVCAAASALEDHPMFNAGRGSVFTHDGHHEMDACVMEGRLLQAGAVAGVQHVRNPIMAARAVMDHSEHVLLAGAGAEAFARSRGIALEDIGYFHSHLRYEQWQQALADDKVLLDHSERKFGTIGAVALDMHGNLAAATSTGGMTNKRWNRIGDSPLVGSGTYANNQTCAISCTGHGEYFIRGVVAYDISCLMEYAGLSLEAAAQKVIMEKQVQMGGDGGIIGCDAQGNTAMIFNTEGMYRGRMDAKGAVTAIYGA
jgi:L-asparaginase / beta-aspartyl-peptidase